jgi:Icc-related predicted phosphoesterase
MKIAAISDTHNQHKKLKIPECDLLIHCGDLTNSGEIWEIKNFCEWMNKTPAKHKIVIPGNHDRSFQNPLILPAIEELFAGANINLLIDKSLTIDNINFYGSPWQPWFWDWAYNFPRYDDGTAAKSTWEKIPVDTDILITHGPPNGILDMVDRDGSRVGCPHLRNRIEKTKIKYHCFGHIHESKGIMTVHGSTYINCSNPGLYEVVQFDYNKG